MLNPRRGYGALRKGRQSSPSAEYFLTLCLRRPSLAFNDRHLRDACFACLRDLERTQAITLRCAVIMPDHVHLLVILGQVDSLSSIVRLFKGRLTPMLREHRATWQPSFHDHRLRPEEDRQAVFLYIFLNPYRKGLIRIDEPWPGYYCAPEDWRWFGELSKDDCPQPAWLA